MKRILAALAVVSLVVGCGPNAQDFRNGLPKKDMVEVKTPAAATSARVARVVEALQGDRAGSYTMTRGATASINGGSLFVLALVKAVTDQRPTTVEEDRAVWGPGNSGDPLDPQMYKMTVTRTGEDSFSYALEAKDKNLGDEAYVVVISGAHTRVQDGDHGGGTFLIDWDAAQTLPEHGNDVGSAQVTYSRDVSDLVTVEAEFLNVHDGKGGLGNFGYRYTRTPGQGGSFEFLSYQDIHDDTSLALPEKFTVMSRWIETGAGRSDYEVSEGNLTAPVTGNECWDTTFASQYVNASWDPAANYGDEATHCAITPAQYSTL